MKFKSNSVILHEGSKFKLDVYIPDALFNIDIPDSIWQSAIDEFNIILDERENVTIKINEIPIDIIKLESITTELKTIGAIILEIFIKKSDYEKIANTRFRIRGYLTFHENSDKVLKMTIQNICWDNNELL